MQQSVSFVELRVFFELLRVTKFFHEVSRRFSRRHTKNSSLTDRNKGIKQKKTPSRVSLPRGKLSLALSYLRLEGTKLTFASCYLSLEGTKLTFALSYFSLEEAKLTFAPCYLSLQGRNLSLQWIKMRQKGIKVRFWRKKEAF